MKKSGLTVYYVLVILTVIMNVVGATAIPTSVIVIIAIAPPVLFLGMGLLGAIVAGISLLISHLVFKTELNKRLLELSRKDK